MSLPRFIDAMRPPSDAETIVASPPLRICALLTDAYGGHGGIAAYNRDLIEAWCADPGVAEVIAFPRKITHELQIVPDKLNHVASAASGLVSFVRQILRRLPRLMRCDIIYCAHINLIPIAWLLSKFLRRPVLLALYGIEAWQPTSRRLTNLLAPRVQRYYSISAYTREKFLAWCPAARGRIELLPNAIHLGEYGVGEKPGHLLDRYKLARKVVLLTFGRLVSEQRAKGFDEVLELLPDLVAEHGNIAYVIAGDGPYRAELERKAATLGLAPHVVFTGYVAEAEKVDLYRTADVYVMPSSGEGFGFVFLEAMACGIPVIASTADGSREAVRDGLLGALVDPGNRGQLKMAIRTALKKSREVPAGLDCFAFPSFAAKAQRIVRSSAVLRGSK